MRILVVEDETGIANFLRDGLREEGYAVDVTLNGSEAVEALRLNDYDLLLVDWMLPGMSGIELCREFRKFDATTPIILISARDSTEDVVFGLDSGVNDYVRKPFSFDELLARVRAQLRKGEAESTQLEVGDLRMDTAAHQVFRGDRAIMLTAKEFALLRYLMHNRGRVCSRTRIIENVWDIHFDTDTSVIDVYINFLRKKLCAEGEPDIIETVRGTGYVIREK
jgi:DNA-binding response OmpR family regulator